MFSKLSDFEIFTGDIPTYGKSGNRDEDEDMLDFEKEAVDDEKSDDECEIVELTGWNSVDPASATGVDLTKLAPQVMTNIKFFLFTVLVGCF